MTGQEVGRESVGDIVWYPSTTSSRLLTIMCLTPESKFYRCFICLFLVFHYQRDVPVLLNAWSPV